MSADRQRLVCLTTSAALGGAETSLLTLLAAMRRLEPSWEITVIAPSEGPLLDRCGPIGVATTVVRYPKALSALGETGALAGTGGAARRSKLIGHGVRAALTLPRYITALRRALRGFGATVIHSNGLKAHVCAALARPAGVRLVWHMHEYVQPRPFSVALLRRLAHRANAIVANSESVRADVAAALGGAQPLRRVYNAVDLAEFRPDGPVMDLASRAGLPPDGERVRIGLVATFACWKGHDVFLEAVARMAQRPRLRAYVIGGPVYDTAGSQWSLDQLRRLAAERGLSDVVGFTGAIDAVPDAMRALDVVVHASTAPEPFGMVVAEAMASGRALVAAKAGGAAELFEDGVDAVGHAPGDAGELASHLDALAGDEAERARLGTAARAAACRRFSPVRMASEFKEVYLG